MCSRSGGLRFVFDELNRNNKPCINLGNVSDMATLTTALTFANEHCIQLDGCCSSRVYASLEALRNDPNYADLRNNLCPATPADTDMCGSC